MATNLPFLLGKKSQEALVLFVRDCKTLTHRQWNLREQMRQVDLAYNREQDWTQENIKARISNTYGDLTKFQNVQVPIVMPVVEAAVTYQASVFLTGNPIFGIVADPTSEDQAVQMETVIDSQATRGGWVREFMMFFRDGFKYNLSALEVVWDRETSAVLETDITFGDGKQGKPKEVLWEGNCIKRIDPYNMFWDTRVPASEVYKDGEFFGYNELKSRIALKQYIQQLTTPILDNITAAFESAFPGGGVGDSIPESYFVPQINPNALIEQTQYLTTNWASWAGIANGDNNKINYHDQYILTTIYARILPSDFNIRAPAPNTPQIWKFVLVNNQVILYAERQTNAHQYLPVMMGQPSEDGMKYQTKSKAQSVVELQQTASVLMSSVMAARRRAISDRGLYDPSRISEANINAANPSAKIPVKPMAYGKPLQEAYYPIPFRDDQSPIMMQQVQQLTGFANIVAGTNQAKQGQFVKGNKTLHEYESVMQNANGRDQMTAMLYEAQVFTPLKYILKINILQYQGGVSLYNPDQQKVIKVDPVALRSSALAFKVSDGLLPVDKIISSETLSTALQTIASSPAIGGAYNIGQLFSYLMKTQNAAISAFEKPPEQIAYEQAVTSWQQVVTQLASQKDADPSKFPPQPKPADYNYSPNTQGAPSPNMPAPAVRTEITNVQKNISQAPELQ